MKGKIDTELLAKLAPKEKPFEVFDESDKSKGMILRVEPSGRMGYFCVYHIDGRKRRYKIGDAKTMTLGQARKLFIIKSGQVAEGKDPGEERKRKRIEQKKAKSRTVGGFFELEYLPWLLTERKSGKATGKRLKSCFEWLFNKPLHEATPFLLQSWQKKKLKAKRSAHTVNRDMVALKAMLSKAVEWNFLEKNPLSNMKRAKAADNSRVRYLSPDEEKQLFAALDQREADGRAARIRFNEWRRQRHLDPFPGIADSNYIDHLKPLVLLALNTGLRRGELFSLEWRDIDFLHNRLTVRAAASKGAKIRHIPLNANSRDALKRWQKQPGDSVLVFPGKKGNRLDNISAAWRKLITDAEVEDFTFHDLRHDFATKTLKAGADIVTVSKLLGHSDLKMTLRYSHVTDETLTAAVERLPANG
jgi:integrase